MKMLQKSAVMRGTDNMVIKEIPVPQIKDKEVLVSLEYVGICGSDVHYYHNGCCGAYKVDLSEDFMLGHECAGTIVEVGKDVENLKVGDRVALEPGITCGKCEFCKSGHYNLCPDVVFLATPPVQGCNEEYIAFPEDMCFKLPENVSTKEGALIEPLSVGFYAAEQGNVGTGDTVVILGSGCIGLVTLLACKAHGAGQIIVADLVQARLDKAMELGATAVINSGKEDALEKIKELVTDEQPEWSGTATELVEILQVEMQPNALSRKLNVSLERLLLEYGIQYKTERGHDGRKIRLTFVGTTA